MLVEHTITRLNDMRLAGMREAYSWQREKPNIHELSFDERFGMLVDREWACRQDRRLSRLLKAAKLRLPACVRTSTIGNPAASTGTLSFTWPHAIGLGTLRTS